MKKNLLLLAVLPLVALASGCDTCERGFELKADLQSLNAQVVAAQSQPELLASSCGNFSAYWDPKLIESSDIIERLAEEHFSSRHSHCVYGHYERQCYRERRRGRHRGEERRHCSTHYVCDAYETETRRNSGYQESKNIGRLLMETRDELRTACSDHGLLNPTLSKAHLATAQLKLYLALGDAERVLTVAGCYNQNGK